MKTFFSHQPSFWVERKKKCERQPHFERVFFLHWIKVWVNTFYSIIASVVAVGASCFSVSLTITVSAYLHIHICRNVDMFKYFDIQKLGICYYVSSYTYDHMLYQFHTFYSLANMNSFFSLSFKQQQNNASCCMF